MKVKNVHLIMEDARKIDGITYTNSTEDQFPYVEAALNSIDNNFKWWKENWQVIEQLISQYLLKTLGKVKKDGVSISSRFTVFHGHDEKNKNVVWQGPAIVYSFKGIPPELVSAISEEFGGLYKGHKMFPVENELVILFG